VVRATALTLSRTHFIERIPFDRPDKDLVRPEVEVASRPDDGPDIRKGRGEGCQLESSWHLIHRGYDGFRDPLARIHADPDHSASEVREIIVGHSTSAKFLVVSFTYRGGNIRLISARPATRRERRDYEEAQ
jgi:uncharacterized DUF497 family protein